MAGSAWPASFATVLRGHRLRAGLTQSALAERAGIGLRTIQDLEEGAHRPQQATVLSLAAALDLCDVERRAFEAVGLPAPRHPRSVARESPFSGGSSSRRSTGAARHYLGIELTSFVGRAAELADLETRLAPDGTASRLLTLTGAGGCGKTRLARRVARELAQRFSHGAWFADLAPLADPHAVPTVVAAAAGVTEQPGRPVESTLVESLRESQALLVLDNCEHLLDAVARLAVLLLESCPRVRILATSRVRIGIAGEATVRVPSLPAPTSTGDPDDLDDPERLLRFDAIRLFVERARDVEPRFGLSRSNAPAVIQVCARLDGIPLAIELAASRVASLGVERISERLDDRFRVLTVGSRTALPRHQTLRASIDWSHDLLSDAERILFRRLAVFAGGFTLEDAEAVCPHPQMDDQIAGAEPERAARRDSTTAARLDRADIVPRLADLIDKSLVHVDGRDGDVRYTLLETVRQYARECLREADEIELLSRAHLSWCLGLATRFQVEVNGPLPTDTLRHVDRDLDNLRAALEWCKADATRTEEGLLLAATLGQFWRLTGRIREGCRHLVELLALCPPHHSPRSRAIALTAAGHLTQLGGDFSRGHAYCAEAVALLRPAGPSMELGQAIVQLGVTAYGLGRPDEAALLWNEALLLGQAFGDDEMEAFANHLLGVIAQDRGDLSLAGVHLTEALRVERKRSRDKASIALTTFEMGIVAMIQGDLGRAAEMYHECLKLWREVGYQVGVALVINGMAWIADRRGQPARAARLASAASTVRDRVGVDLFVSHRPLHEKTLERTRASLGEDAWNRAWAEGSAMTADEAIQYAWQTTDAEDSSPDGSAG